MIESVNVTDYEPSCKKVYKELKMLNCLVFGQLDTQ